jgi:hypothetical protein
MQSAEFDAIRLLHRLSHLIWSATCLTDEVREEAGTIQRYIQDTYDESVWDMPDAVTRTGRKPQGENMQTVTLPFEVPQENPPFPLRLYNSAFPVEKS